MLYAVRKHFHDSKNACSTLQKLLKLESVENCGEKTERLLCQQTEQKKSTNLKIKLSYRPKAWESEEWKQGNFAQLYKMQ